MNWKMSPCSTPRAVPGTSYSRPMTCSNAPGSTRAWHHATRRRTLSARCGESTSTRDAPKWPPLRSYSALATHALEGALPRPNIICARSLPATATGLADLLEKLPKESGDSGPSAFRHAR